MYETKEISIEKICIKISFEGGVARPLFNYDTNADTDRGG